MAVVTTNVPEPGFPDEGGATPADIVERAREIAVTLVERQAETEKRTYYAEDTHEAFARAGFYRILVPKRYGGHEFGIDTFLEVVRTLTRSCPSTGWMYCLGAAHALAAATIFGERAQDELFAGGDFISPATIVPAGTAERVDGGWRLTGTWTYCSGSPYATHFLGHTLVPGENEEPVPMFFAVARAQWQRLDDWGGQLGLKGSGSHSIRMDGAFVPEHLTLDGHMSQFSVAGGTPGFRLHGNPQYGGGPLSFMNLESAVLAVGIAQCALDCYEELMRTRTTIFPPVLPRTEDPDYQYWYGEAASMISTAQAALERTVQHWQEACVAGPAAFTPEFEMGLATNCRQAVQLSWHAVEGYLFPTAGSSSVRSGERMERAWRDMSTLHTHAGFSVFLAAKAQRELAKARFGTH
jgi:3-hydroxy-9,10-secoandrosta-1,3,5(10)-triene-9,17-dione monooxygenase